jgi:hypothetical protein
MRTTTRPLYNAQRAALDKLIVCGGQMIVTGRKDTALYNSLVKLGYCQRRGMGTGTDPVNVYYIP